MEVCLIICFTSLVQCQLGLEVGLGPEHDTHAAEIMLIIAIVHANGDYSGCDNPPQGVADENASAASAAVSRSHERKNISSGNVPCLKKNLAIRGKN